MPEVIIDGVRYIPAKEALANEAVIALVAHMEALARFVEDVPYMSERHRDAERMWLQATKPAASLARRKAEWQMEAMEGWLIQVRHMEGLNTFDCMESAELYAEELRRQAEGGADD